MAPNPPPLPSGLLSRSAHEFNRKKAWNLHFQSDSALLPINETLTSTSQQKTTQPRYTRYQQRQSLLPQPQLNPNLNSQQQPISPTISPTPSISPTPTVSPTLIAIPTISLTATTSPISSVPTPSPTPAISISLPPTVSTIPSAISPTSQTTPQITTQISVQTAQSKFDVSPQTHLHTTTQASDIFSRPVSPNTNNNNAITHNNSIELKKRGIHRRDLVKGSTALPPNMAFVPKKRPTPLPSPPESPFQQLAPTSSTIQEPEEQITTVTPTSNQQPLHFLEANHAAASNTSISSDTSSSSNSSVSSPHSISVVSLGGVSMRGVREHRKEAVGVIGSGKATNSSSSSPQHNPHQVLYSQLQAPDPFSFLAHPPASPSSLFFGTHSPLHFSAQLPAISSATQASPNQLYSSEPILPPPHSHSHSHFLHDHHIVQHDYDYDYFDNDNSSGYDNDNGSLGIDGSSTPSILTTSSSSTNSSGTSDSTPSTTISTYDLFAPSPNPLFISPISSAYLPSHFSCQSPSSSPSPSPE